MRIAIIGAGIAGLTAAWLLDETEDVAVYESAARVGGHADSVAVNLDGRTVHVDLGAQHLAPGTFPAHTALRAILDIPADDVLEAPLHTTVMSTSAPQQLLVTPHAPLDATGARDPVTGEAWAVLGRFVAHAAAFEQDGDWTTTLGELTAELGLAEEWTDHLIHPWLASFVGCGSRQAATMSARAAIAWVTRTAPAAPDTAPVFQGLTRGMHHLAETLARALKQPVRTGVGVRRLDVGTDGGTVTVHDAAGGVETFDRVVLAVPAPAPGRILTGVRGYDKYTAAFAAFDYVSARVAIHRDPAYMTKEHAHWSTNNITVHDGWAETSTWYGPIIGADLFKSWTTHREQPTETVAQAEYEHLCVTPAAVRTRTHLRQLHDNGPVHFAGSYLRDVDSQESAVGSAVAAARTLAPTGARLNTLTDLTGHVD